MLNAINVEISLSGLWKLYVQIMLKEKAYAYRIHLFDWPHGDCSLISVGVI